MVKYKKQKTINLAFQWMVINKKYPGWKCTSMRSKLICEGNIKPSVMSATYLIRISYTIKENPKIYLVDPPLQKNCLGERADHLYSDDSLCIFHPRFNEWNGTKLIAHTIIPWTSLWLYNYEVWLFTGEWKGGGVHPPKRN